MPTLDAHLLDHGVVSDIEPSAHVIRLRVEILLAARFSPLHFSARRIRFVLNHFVEHALLQRQRTPFYSTSNS